MLGERKGQGALVSLKEISQSTAYQTTFQNVTETQTMMGQAGQDYTLTRTTYLYSLAFYLLNLFAFAPSMATLNTTPLSCFPCLIWSLLLTY